MDFPLGRRIDPRLRLAFDPIANYIELNVPKYGIAAVLGFADTLCAIRALPERS